MNKHKAISLAELLVVIAIGIVVTTLSVSGFINLSNSDLIEAASQSLLSEFRQAYSDSIESLANSTYGIHVATSSATRFVGTTYQNGANGNVVFTFPNNVTASATPSNFVFQQISGTTTSGIIQVYISSNPNYERTILVASTGVPELQ